MRLHVYKPLLFCLLLLPGLPPAAPAAAPPAPVPAAVTPVAPPAAHAPPLFADDWWTWKSIYRGFENCLSSRGGLLRMGVIGMIIALFLIMFGNKWSK
jgi:hypothetical protein